MLRQRGANRADLEGVFVKEVTSGALPAHLVGAVLESVAGEAVSKCSYDAVIAKVKAAGRPLKMTFSGGKPVAAVEAAPVAVGSGAEMAEKEEPVVVLVDTEAALVAAASALAVSSYISLDLEAGCLDNSTDAAAGLRHHGQLSLLQMRASPGSAYPTAACFWCAFDVLFVNRPTSSILD